MEDLRDELDASALFGSGYICVVGPPSSGKTTTVLDYLVARERRFKALHGASSSAQEHRPTFCLEYVGAKSVSNALLRYVMRRLHPTTRARRLSYECTPLEFGASLIQWLEGHAEGSELHIVVDDADVLDYETQEMNLWLSHCLRSPHAQSRLVVLWMISELPLRLANCHRFHFVARPEPQSIVQWLQRQYEEERAVCVDAAEEEGEGEQEGGDGVDGTASSGTTATTTVSPDGVQRVVLEAFTYYATRQPMRSSVVSRDVRLLIQRVYALLPALLLEAFPSPSAGAVREERRLDARHFAAAWGQHRSDSGAAQPSSPSTTAAAAAGGEKGRLQDPLVVALKRLGYSAVLLAFAAFYGGAVPKSKQRQVFGHMQSGERRSAQQEAKGQSHKAAVLTASAHVIEIPRLAYLYDAMLRMCVPHIDPLEFTTASAALQYVQGFVAWGLLTPVVTQRHRSYHCWIPVSTAQHLARELALSLFDLIPS